MAREPEGVAITHGAWTCGHALGGVDGVVETRQLVLDGIVGCGTTTSSAEIKYVPGYAHSHASLDGRCAIDQLYLSSNTASLSPPFFS